METVTYKGVSITFNLYDAGEFSVQYDGDDLICTTIEEAREVIDDLTAGDLYGLAYDVTMFFIDLDPYGADDEKEYGESDEDQAARIAATIASPAELSEYLDDIAEWLDGDGAEAMEAIEAFRVRLRKIA